MERAVLYRPRRRLHIVLAEEWLKLVRGDIPYTEKVVISEILLERAEHKIFGCV